MPMPVYSEPVVDVSLVMDSLGHYHTVDDTRRGNVGPGLPSPASTITLLRCDLDGTAFTLPGFCLYTPSHPPLPAFVPYTLPTCRAPGMTHRPIYLPLFAFPAHTCTPSLIGAASISATLVYAPYHLPDTYAFCAVAAYAAVSRYVPFTTLLDWTRYGHRHACTALQRRGLARFTYSTLFNLIPLN